MHWELVHEENAADDVSWYQATPRTSLDVLASLAVPRDARILDVGCGQWGLAPALAQLGYAHVSALDLSGAALQRARAAMGRDAERVEWIERDVLDFESSRPYDVWHDRAVLHFFTDPQGEARYADSVRRNLAPGGHAVVATFARDGPDKCSGLAVTRHDTASIARVLGDGFDLVGSRHEIHHTPWGKPQAFQWAILKKQGERSA